MDAFRGRVAVVTGGASGIGRALGAAFAERGARVVLADRDEAGLAQAAGALARLGTEVEAVPTDVRRPESVEALAERSFARFGAVHVLCNNAGVSLFGPLAETTPEDWAFILEVNLLGVANGVRAFVPRMIEQRQGGHVVNTASMSGLRGIPRVGAYCASKFAVVGLSEVLHEELREHDIGVSVVCPMLVDTHIRENSRRLRGGPPPSGLPVPVQGRTLSPEAVAARILAAVERRELYVFTHPESADLLRSRARVLEEAAARV